MLWTENAMAVLGAEVLHVVVFGLLVERAEETIGIAEGEPSLFRRVVCCLAHLGPWFGGIECATQSTGDQGGDHQGGNGGDKVVASVVFDACGMVFYVVPTVDEQTNECECDDDDRQVVCDEVKDDGQVVAIACKMGVLKGEALHGVGEINDVSRVHDDDGRIGDQVDDEKDALIPAPLTEAEWQDGEEDERGIGQEQRHKVKAQRALCDAQSFAQTRDMSQIRLVNHVKSHLKDGHNDINWHKAQQKRGDVVVPKRTVVLGFGIFFPHWFFGLFWTAKILYFC